MAIKPQSPAFYSRVYVSALVIVFTFVFAMIFLAGISNNYYERELHNWEVKLNLIADSRVNAVGEWVKGQFGEVKGLADNPSLKLYMTELMAGGKLNQDHNSPMDSPTQEVYLRHLLTITAERGGFSPKDTEAERIPANVENVGQGGIALLTKTGEVVVATGKMPPVVAGLAAFVKQSPAGESRLFDMDLAANGRLRIGFLEPIFSIQGEDKASDQIGWVFGVRELGNSLFAHLKHPGTTELSMETLLVRKEPEGITYLSPLADKTEPLRKYLTWPEDIEDDEALAEAVAVERPGSFVIRPDYALSEVLATGRNVPGTPWVLVAKVNEVEAMADAERARLSLVYQLFWGVIAVLAAVVAAWRHGTSRSALRMSKRLAVALKQSKSREAMLAVVTNSQPGAIFMVDVTHRCWFANEALASQAGVPAKDLVGKPIINLLGPALAEMLNEKTDKALITSQTVNWMRREPATKDKPERVLRYKHIPLRQLPVDAAGAGEPGVLILEQDITAVVQERESHNRTLRGLIDTLVAMVDQRDPYAANHSVMVARIAREVAQEMELEPEMVRTTEIAGTIMNIGKMVVPTEWLTKAGALNEKEREAIRESLLSSADMIESVNFEGPVADTLRQSLEHWDGTGMDKLKGEEILVSARIIAAANAFVGMISPRAYRKAIKVDEALKNLMKGMDKEFDRRVIVALANYIDNHGGREMVNELAQGPKAA